MEALSAGELHLDADSLANWLSTGKLPQEPESPGAAMLEDIPVEAMPPCDSFYAGIPDAPECTETGAAETTPHTLCSAQQEPEPAIADESPMCASSEPARERVRLHRRRSVRFEEPEAAAQEYEASMHSGPAVSYAELASSAVPELSSELALAVATTEQAVKETCRSPRECLRCHKRSRCCCAGGNACQ